MSPDISKEKNEEAIKKKTLLYMYIHTYIHHPTTHRYVSPKEQESEWHQISQQKHRKLKDKILRENSKLSLPI